jgi:hypothetical protein
MIHKCQTETRVMELQQVMPGELQCNHVDSDWMGNFLFRNMWEKWLRLLNCLFYCELHMKFESCK